MDMELLHMPKDMPLPVLPASMASVRDAPRPVLKSNSLARMEELQAYLKQCDDKQTFNKYYKVLSSCSQDHLAEFARQLKSRAAFLAVEEQREYKRAKLLHVIGAPCTLPAAPNSAYADAFASEVLAGDETEAAVGALGGAHCATPATGQQQQQQEQQQRGGSGSESAVPRARAAVAAAIEAGAAAPALAGPGSEPAAFVGSPDENSPPLAVLTASTIEDHQLQRISPGGVLGQQEQQQQQQQQSAIAAALGRGRQPTLPEPK